MSFDLRIPTPVAVAVGLAAVAAAGYFAFARLDGGRELDVHYPYYCVDCKAVFDVSLLKRDLPRSWRVAPGGGSDSVVVCPKCDRGKAYPVARCSACQGRYLVHLAGCVRCPKCNPTPAVQAALAAGVQLMPPALAGR